MATYSEGITLDTGNEINTVAGFTTNSTTYARVSVLDVQAGSSGTNTLKIGSVTFNVTSGNVGHEYIVPVSSTFDITGIMGGGGVLAISYQKFSKS